VGEPSIGKSRVFWVFLVSSVGEPSFEKRWEKRNLQMKPCGVVLAIDSMDNLNTNNGGGDWLIVLAILIFISGWVGLLLYINSLV
jgi:hypothetical protein